MGSLVTSSYNLLEICIDDCFLHPYFFGRVFKKNKQTVSIALLLNFFRCILILYVCVVCVCVCVCECMPCVHVCPWGSEGVRSPEAGVTGGWKPSDPGVTTQTGSHLSGANNEGFNERCSKQDMVL